MVLSCTAGAPAFTQHEHSWVWIPGRASLARDDVDGFDFQIAVRIPATQCARVVHEPPSTKRAQGMPGARCTRSPVCKVVVSTRVSSPRGSPEQPGIPCAMVLTAYFVLSPAIGLSCHRHQRKTFRKLDASVEASGPHDFAVRVSTFRQARRRVHRIPLPPSVTIAIRPSFGNETARVVEVFLANEEAENFCGGDGQQNRGIARRGKSVK
jgi:hypothetical protein